MTETLSLLSEISSILAPLSLIAALILTFRNIKKTSPGEALRKWQSRVDEKLDSDLKKLNRLEEESVEHRAFERLMLHCMKGMLEHELDGNHTGVMKELISKIDTFLIER